VGYLPRPAPEGSTLPAPQVDDLSRPPITFRPQIVPAPAPSRIPRPEEGGAGETPRSLLKSAGPKAIDLQPQRETDINQHRRLERDQVTPAAPPLVRVSIGRVEVRAVVTSQPAPSTRAAQAQPVPRSFLQEYLQERNRGTR
jgi:hypothetical protein